MEVVMPYSWFFYFPPSRFAAFVHFWTLSLWLTVGATCSQTGPTTWAESLPCLLWSLSPYGQLWSCPRAREPSDRQERKVTVLTKKLLYVMWIKKAFALHSLFLSSAFLFVLSAWRPTGILLLSWEKNAPSWANQRWIQCQPFVLTTKIQYKPSQAQ